MSISTLSIVCSVGSKRGLGAGELGEVAAPFLDADRLAASPVHRDGGDAGGGEQAGHHGDDVVRVEGVIDAGRVDVDGDGVTRQHHVQMDGGPATVVPVGHGQARDGGREFEALCGPPCRAFGRDLADAVGPEERPDTMVVTERTGLVEHAVAVGFVDGGRRAVEEGPGPLVVLHEMGQPAAVGGQVVLPVVRLGHREVEDVVGVGGQPAHVACRKVDWHALDTGRFELAARRRRR